MIGVVLMHTQIEMRHLGVDTGVVATLVELLSAPLMPLFFFVSGLLASAALGLSWAEFWSRRIAPLAWVFLIWQPAVLAYKLAQLAWLPVSESSSFTEQVLKAVVSPIRPNGELWFVWALALFLIVARSARAIPIRVQFAAAALVSLGWMSADQELGGAALRALGAGWEGVPRNFVFFLAGIAGAGAAQLWIQRRLTWFPLTTIVWVCVFFALKAYGEGWPGPVEFFVSAVGVVGLIGIAGLISESQRLRRVGRQTLPIYLVHMPVVVGLVVAVWSGGILSGASTPVAAALTVAIAGGSVGCALALYRLTTGSTFGWLFEPPDWFKAPGRREPPTQVRR